MTTASRSAPSQGPVVVALTTVLNRTLRALGDAGEPVAASRLAAEAWVALRQEHPAQAEAVNRAMHHLARREAELQADSFAEATGA